MPKRRSPTASTPERVQALKAIGKRIKAFRGAQKLSQEELAARIDMSVATVSSMERGLSAPSFDTLLRLARELDRRLAEFFEVEPLESRPPELARIVSLLETQPATVLLTAAAQIQALVDLAGELEKRRQG